MKTTPTRRMRRAAAALMGGGLLTAAALVGAAPAMASPGQTVQSGADGITPQQVAQALAGSGVTPSNVTYTGAPVSMGIFSGMSAIGFDSGIILSSGDAKSVVGPNTGDSTTTSLGTPGDTQLDALVTPNTTNDAAVLQFDFVPSSNTIQFKYVFSSEEYNEFVGGSVDDVFGFFVNGNNCATVNGQRVSINTINGGNPLGTNPSNANLFINNDPSDGTPTVDTQMDGLTTILTCQANVNPGTTNTMKLAIADTGDTSYDSNVFVQMDSLVSNQPPNCPSPQIGVPYQTPTNFGLGVSDPNPSDTLTYNVGSPSNGTISGMAPNLTYTPNAGYQGDDSLTYSATDQAGASCSGTVTFIGGAAPVQEVSNSNPVPGETITVKMCCFAPGTLVDVYIASSIPGAPPTLLGTFPADSTGTVTANVQLPEGLAAGEYTLTMTGTGVGGAVVEVSQSISIGAVITQTNTPAAANVTVTTQAAPLPPTGAYDGLLAIIGMALIGGGVVLLRIERRRMTS